eukprot:EG_transcript_54021
MASEVAQEDPAAAFNADWALLPVHEQRAAAALRRIDALTVGLAEVDSLKPKRRIYSKTGNVFLLSTKDVVQSQLAAELEREQASHQLLSGRIAELREGQAQFRERFMPWAAA